MFLHHPLMWCKVQSPLERGSPQACAHNANPSILDLLPALSSPPLPLEEGREPPNQAWVSAAIVIGHRDEARTGLFLMKTVVSWTLDSSTGISLLMRNSFPQLQLPSSQMHFGPCRPGCLLLSTQKDLSNNAIPPVPPSSTFCTNRCADKFCLNRKYYFSIKMIFSIFLNKLAVCITLCFGASRAPKHC